ARRLVPGRSADPWDRPAPDRRGAAAVRPRGDGNRSSHSVSCSSLVIPSESRRSCGMTRSGRQVFVYEAIRTPRGRARREGGTLAGLTAGDLLAQLLTELQSRGVPADKVDDVVMGVSTAVDEQAPDVARLGVILAG